MCSMMKVYIYVSLYSRSNCITDTSDLSSVVSIRLNLSSVDVSIGC